MLLHPHTSEHPFLALLGKYGIGGFLPWRRFFVRVLFLLFFLLLETVMTASRFPPLADR
jgi:hypothetical protein